MTNRYLDILGWVIGLLGYYQSLSGYIKILNFKVCALRIYKNE